MFSSCWITLEETEVPISGQVRGGVSIDQQGIHPSEGKVKAIKAAPNPRNLTELKAYLGLLTYYVWQTSSEFSQYSWSIVSFVKKRY